MIYPLKMHENAWYSNLVQLQEIEAISLVIAGPG